MSQLGIIISREFNERVRKKSFIITTILVPLLLLGVMAVPTLIMLYSSSETKRIAVIDRSGLIAPSLEDNDELEFVPCDRPLEEALADDSGDIFGVLVIDEQILNNSASVRLYASSSTSVMMEESIEKQIAHIIETEKLKTYNIENLPEIMEAVKTSVTLHTIRSDKDGAGRSVSAGASFAIGYVLAFVLYMFLLIYGQMVMTAVIEEKNSRVLDVLVTSVKPFQLMLGKILGVASVAVVQVLIWGVLIFGIGSFATSALLPHMNEEAAEQLAAYQAGTLDTAAVDAGDIEMMKAFTTLTDFGYLAGVFCYLLLFLVGGYLFYSAMFAAVGASVDNATDAGQLTTPITIPIILALMVMFVVMKDPNSSLAFWFSIIPFTSPIVMMARIPAGIPAWEPIVSLAVLYGSIAFMVWVAAKIYRVGILIHGKKPTFKELYKWIKQA